MSLETLWFCLIAFLWSGYLVLEGFDFGVGMLLPFLPRDEVERGVLLDTIGPVWDGNEVWLVVAGGATFAAFPAWYATLFSGFYLALLLILAFLIVRVVSFEWRGKSADPRWRSAWLAANVSGSVAVPFLWGIALADLVHGVPLDSGGAYAGGFADLFSAYSVFAGVALVLLCAFHGATFLTLRTTGELCERARAAAARLALPAVAATAVFVAWTVVTATGANQKDAFPPALPAVLAAAALVIAAVFAHRRRSGIGFVMTAVGTALTVATIFTSLYPRVLVSAPDFGNSLTISSAASQHYTLAVITVVAVVVTPVVVLYQAWTYHVFRARLSGGEATPEPPAPPAPHPGA
jgi:cytochrome d ubiquinol oxidase subunit II